MRDESFGPMVKLVTGDWVNASKVNAVIVNKDDRVPGGMSVEVRFDDCSIEVLTCCDDQDEAEGVADDVAEAIGRALPEP